jgi:hypothetical protein
VSLDREVSIGSIAVLIRGLENMGQSLARDLLTCFVDPATREAGPGAKVSNWAGRSPILPIERQPWSMKTTITP